MAQQNTFFSLEQVIDRHPLTVSPATPLHEVIRLMHEWGNSCSFDDAKDDTSEDNTFNRNNSCVLIEQDGHLQGIFTERDLVKLVAKKIDTKSVTVGEMMVSDVVTLALKKDTDIFTALSFLRENRIRHLPVVDDKHNLIGLVTAKNMRQKLQPINLMKWREASEVMNTELVYTSPDDSVRNVAVLMAERDISCIAICVPCQSQSNIHTGTYVRPVGIITERDIVQYQNLGIDLEQPARNLMSTPLFLVNPKDSLWDIYQQMKQRRVRRLLVADEAGLKGIITQSSLLQIFDPTEMYGVIEVLQRQVCQLEGEREILLQKQNEELEQEVKERTTDLFDKNQQLERDRAELRRAQTKYGQQLEFERLITRISARFLSVSIEQLSVEIESALETIGKFIQVDTGYIFRLAEDGDTFSMTHEWSIEAKPKIQNAQNLSRAMFPWTIAKIERGETIGVNSLSELPTAAATDRESWQAFNFKSLLVVPYKQSDRFVGWLCFASSSLQTTQSPSIINLLQVVGEIIASTLQRQETSLALRASESKLNSILSSLKDVIWSLDAQTFETLYINSAVETIHGRRETEFYRHPQLWLKVVHPLDRERVSNFVRRLPELGKQDIEYRIVRPNGEIRWILDRARVICDRKGTPIRLDGIASDITASKQAKIALKESEAKYRTLFNSIDEGFCIIEMIFDENEHPFDYRFLELNSSFEQQTGLSNARGKRIRELFPNHEQYWFKIYGNIALTGEPARFENFARELHRWYDVFAFRYGAPEQRQVAVLFQDITERKQAETKIRQQAALLDLTHDTVLVRNLANTITFWNKGAVEMYGWQTAEALGQKSHQLLKAKFSQPLSDIETTLFEREYWSGELVHQKKDGSKVTILGRWSLLKDSEGNPQQILEINHNISDRKRRERILKDIASGISVEVGENFFHSLVEFLSKTLEVNFAFISQLVDLEASSVKTLAVYGNGEDRDNFVYSLANAPCNNVINRGLCLYPQAVRQLFPNVPLLEATEAQSYAGMPIFDPAGNVLGLIAVVDRQPFSDVALVEEVLRIFATRASTELERQQAELTLLQSEQKFRAIFDHTFQFIGLLEPNGRLIEANRTSLDFVGLTPQDVREKLFWETPWWSGSLKAQELLKQGIERAAKGEFVRFEVEHPGTEDRVVTVDFSLTPIKDETGRVVMLIPEGRNISDRKQAEAELAKSNQMLQAISSIQTQYLTDAQPQILFDGMLAHLLELTESEYGFIGEIHFADDGSPQMEEGYMKVRGRPYLKTHAITNIAWNEETRAFYAENAPKGMEFHNLETLFGAVMVTGEPVIANSPSTDPRSGGIPEGHPELNAFLGVPFYKNNQMTGMVGIANRQGGYDKSLVYYLQPFLDTCSRIIEAYRSDRLKRQAEAKIREQAALLDVATDAIMVRNLDQKISFWSQGAEKLYGWTGTEVSAEDINKYLYGRATEKLTQIQRTVLTKGEWQGELNQVTKAGKEIVVESRWTLVKDELNNPHSYLIVNTNITEQKQLESQFLRTQRLESLGTLAGGIAHDLNNILAPILGFSRLLPLKLPDVDEQTKGFFKIMENNANRGSALVKQILTFSRGLEGDRGIIQIRHLISEIAQIIGETFPKSIELDINAPKNLWTVNADINQLHQVLMNLCVNARDAMPDGGKLTINAENITLDAEYARLHLDAKEDSYVSITVSDTGIGIPPEIIDRIFEPFFTTKEIGRGTGLGLSTVIGIVKSHGGFVEVASQRDRTIRNTQFKVFLPASDLAENNPLESEEILNGNGELILVVDDETAILEVTKATLETYNYRTIAASNGMDAIALYAQQQDIKVVIMDIMMPTMDGKTAIRTLKKINPEVKIIAVSGLIERQEIVANLDSDVVAFMNKPYSNDDLLKLLRNVIND